LTVGRPDKHKSTAAEIACLGMDYGQRKASSHGSVNCVAAVPHHLNASPRCQFVHTGHHRVTGMYGPQGRRDRRQNG
jgi:hypothetical protein